ncbi:MAG: hypothetical protein HYW65_03770, partial [Candidatus Liptonbacteria bacterium]|nr:hypothetical protein [Candidatus Liptonbacteria bacterium]MBI2623659.1 hypothetical protein [Candidatus Liptonbacteria bacterium]
GSTSRRHLEDEEADEAQHIPIPETASFDEFAGHELSIEKVKHLY